MSLSELNELYELIKSNDCIELGIFQLNNVLKSEFNFNIDRIYTNPKNIGLVSDVYVNKILENSFLDNNLDISHVVNLNTMTRPLMGSIGEKISKNILSYHPIPAIGENYVSGNYSIGDSCILICDVVSSGFEITTCIKRLEKVGLIVDLVVCLVDYKIGGLEDVKTEYNMCSVYDIIKMTEHFTNQKHFTKFELNKIVNSIDCLSKIVNYIKENRDKPKEEQDQRLIEMSTGDILTQRERNINEKVETYEKDLEQYNANFEEYNTDKVKVERRSEEIVLLERKLVEKNNYLISLREETQKMTELKHSQIKQSESDSLQSIMFVNLCVFLGNIFVCMTMKDYFISCE